MKKFKFNRFNLEAALRGEPVVTEEGKEVKLLKRFEDSCFINGVVENEIHRWLLCGKDLDNVFHLYMKERERPSVEERVKRLEETIEFIRQSLIPDTHSG